MSAKFKRINVTQEMIDGKSHNGLYSHSEPGLYIETFDGRGEAWLQKADSRNSSIITCAFCDGEFTNNSCHADATIICPHCKGERETQKTQQPHKVAKKMELTPSVSVYIMCACGHETDHPMSTSSGSSCPACYDRMSE